MTREHKAEQGEHGRITSKDRRVLRATLALSTAAILGAVAGPAVHASAVTDPAAETTAVEMLKATYFNDVDTKNWLALRQLFAPDAVVDTTGSFGPYFPNRDSFIAFTALTLSAINTRHQGYDPQIDLTSDTTANAVWTMEDRLSLAGLVTIHGYGHYTDNYEQVDGHWVITSSKLTRTGFGLEFPAFENFATGLADAYKSGGPIAALVYVGPGLANIPISAVRELVGAIASNFGGPPAKAEQITVPPGSTGVTTEPPGVTTVPSTVTSSAKSFALHTSATTAKSSRSTAEPAQSTEAHAGQGDGNGKPEMSTVGATTTSSKTHDDDAKDAASSTTRTTADSAAAGKESDTPTTAAGHKRADTATTAAAHTSADTAKAGSESSGESQP